LIKSPDIMLRDEAAMRAFYESCGISPQTTEAAILARRNKPYDETKPSVFKGKRRKQRTTDSSPSTPSRDAPAK
jgi:hypothetical protein